MYLYSNDSGLYVSFSDQTFFLAWQSILIALGVVLAGRTDHHKVIADSTAVAFQQASLQYEIPVINGVLTTETPGDAIERVKGKADRGREFAMTALAMAIQRAELLKQLNDE